MHTGRPAPVPVEHGAHRKLERAQGLQLGLAQDYGRTYIPKVCKDVDVILTSADEPLIYNENVFVLPISQDLLTVHLLAGPAPTARHRSPDDAFPLFT